MPSSGETTAGTHMIVGRDHAGPGEDSAGTPFYAPDDAHELARKHEDEVGIQIVPFTELVYVREYDGFLAQDEVPEGADITRISGTELRRRLNRGIDLPVWFTFRAVEEELRRLSPPRSKQGVTIFLTGLSGAGKSTIARVLLVRFREMGDRPVTLLDGDVVREHLSAKLGFSKEDRDLNILRIGFVASELTKAGALVICASIAPYDEIRRRVRDMVDESGGFLLVHVATPLEVCESRDRKGLYAKARAGIIQEFTGISDPYEPPDDAEVVVDTTELTPEEAARRIVDHLEREGYISVGKPRSTANANLLQPH